MALIIGTSSGTIDIVVQEYAVTGIASGFLTFETDPPTDGTVFMAVASISSDVGKLGNQQERKVMTYSGGPNSGATQMHPADGSSSSVGYLPSGWHFLDVN